MCGGGLPQESFNFATPTPYPRNSTYWAYVDVETKYVIIHVQLGSSLANLHVDLLMSPLQPFCENALCLHQGILCPDLLPDQNYIY